MDPTHNAEGVNKIWQLGILWLICLIGADVRWEADVGVDNVAADHLWAVSLLGLREEGSDHQGAQHEAEPNHGVQGLGEGRAAGRAQSVQHQGVARGVQTTNEHPGDHHN